MVDVDFDVEDGGVLVAGGTRDDVGGAVKGAEGFAGAEVGGADPGLAVLGPEGMVGGDAEGGGYLILDT